MSAGETPGEKRRRIAVTITFFAEAIRFIIIPLILLMLVLSQFPLLTPDMAARIPRSLILFGGMVALFSAMEAYFPKGTYLKMIFGLLSVATLCGWFWSIFNGEELTFPYGRANIAINIVDLMLVIIAAISLKGLLHVTSFMAASEENRRREATLVRKREERAATRARKFEVIPDNDVHESGFLHWYHEIELEEPPPPEDMLTTCPVCFREVQDTEKICPDCGAWLKGKKA